MNKEMPKYQCRKQVWALRIKEINQATDGSGNIAIIPEEEGYLPIIMSRDYAIRHQPEVGGYYVRYEGGYQSYSPKDAFEQGYREFTVTDKRDFKSELETLINVHSKENGSDTPDFILAEYLSGALENWNKTVNMRRRWYNPPGENLLVEVKPA